MNWLGLNLNYKKLRVIVDVFAMVIARLLTGIFNSVNNTFDKNTLIFFNDIILIMKWKYSISFQLYQK